ncbi:MAG: hypothetical protein E7422_00560 [Ruminococcaceae bacterium]|nr:hypothetical protein [Oscillospiraceae bacterium]
MKNEKKDNTALMTPGFHGDTALDENGRMKGIYVPMAGVSCAYSLIVQDATIKPPPYAVRGSVKLLTPSGQIFKSKARPSVSATARKKEEDPLTRQPPNSIHVQKKSINSHSTNAEDLKQAIIKNSRKLVEENAKYLRSELEKQTRVKELCFALVHQMNTRRYLSSLNERGMATSEDAQHRRELLIKKLADSELGVVGIADITDAMLDRVRKQIGKNWREYFKEAADLLTFALVRKHQFEGNNCFEAYLEAHPEQKKRDTKRRQGLSGAC